MRFLIIALTLFCVTSVVAAVSSTSTSTSHPAQPSLRNNKPITVDFVLASEQTKDMKTSKTSGSYNKLDASFLYAFNPNDEIRLFASGIYLAQNDPKAEDKWMGDLAEVMYRRKKILDEEWAGVRLDSELKYYRLLESENIRLYGFDGAYVPQLIFTKNWSGSFVTEFKARQHFYLVNNDRPSTLKNETRFYFTPAYILTDSLFFPVTFKYQHKRRQGQSFSHQTFTRSPQETEHLTVHPAAMYMFNRQILLEGYVESEIMTSHDHQVMKQNWAKNYVLGAALYWNAY